MLQTVSRGVTLKSHLAQFTGHLTLLFPYMPPTQSLQVATFGMLSRIFQTGCLRCIQNLDALCTAQLLLFWGWKRFRRPAWKIWPLIMHNRLYYRCFFISSYRCRSWKWFILEGFLAEMNLKERTKSWTNAAPSKGSWWLCKLNRDVVLSSG